MVSSALAGLTDLDGAITQIQQAIARRATANRQANLGMLQHARGRLQEAEAAFRLAVEKRPGEPVFHYHLGLAYSKAGDKAAARQALEQALKLKADFEGADDARKLLRSLG